MKEAIMKNIIDVYLLYGFELAEETKDPHERQQVRSWIFSQT